MKEQYKNKCNVKVKKFKIKQRGITNLIFIYSGN